jgi:hypothetical protein
VGLDALEMKAGDAKYQICGAGVWGQIWEERRDDGSRIGQNIDDMVSS